MQSSRGSAVPFDTLAKLSTAVGKYLSYPVAGFLVILGLFVYRSNLIARFKNIFNMQRLRKLEQPIWPQITPVVKLDLVKEDLDKGPWAMAMTPTHFGKHHNLLKAETKDGKYNVTLLSGAAHRVFALQLGALRTNFEKMPIHVQALFAIFAARGNRDRDAADKLLKQLSLSSETGKLNFTGTRELMTKHMNSELVTNTINKHAYIVTMMASMLEFARTDGVLASSEFLWLKPVDRKLWYMMNSVGRQTAVPEIAGAFAHWQVEKKLGRPLQVPMVDEAVKGLEMALKEIIFEPGEV
jgi:intracellular multiplication protein IcmP